MYPEKHKSFIDQVQRGDYSGSTSDAAMDPQEATDSCVSAPVAFL